MAEPITFTSETPRYKLPLLFSGQAQKEFFFNEAQTVIDALLHLSVEGVAGSPPIDPADGECWLVATGASGDWSDNEETIAYNHASSWKFISPKDGMIAYDRSAGQFLIYTGEWQSSSRPSSPIGGSIVDQEARVAISAIIECLSTMGITPNL